ncbi:uncharacterized protein LOC117228549 [Megalopta genalis]|uniref:uncharacterized protein LOC117228549 n=1 Tax=Megalopta genalis TaxID=115081 RepID=UPI003FD373B5
MSGPGKSARPLRQLSLQPTAPRRQQIRRQRSAEDEKSLQICASPLPRGKHGSGKLGFERPKVRVAWSENHRKNEKELEQVEVVARQIPGRTRPGTGKSRGYIGIEKPPILCSRQELAERLRLAWKHREENKTNINIFLAHGTVEDRCDSEMSSHASVTTPSSSSSTLRGSNTDETRILSDNSTIMRNKQTRRLEARTSCDDILRKEDENAMVKSDTVAIKDSDASVNKGEEESSNFMNYHQEMRKIAVGEDSEVSEIAKTEPSGESDARGRQEDLTPGNSNIDDCAFNPANVKKKTSTALNVSSTLPSLKIETSPATDAKTSKNDPSSAKQKRAVFHSGANRAFLDPIRTEYKWSSMVEKVTPAVKAEKDTPIPSQEASDDARTDDIVISAGTLEKIATPKVIAEASSTIDKCARIAKIENKDCPLVENKVLQKTRDDNKMTFSIIRRTVTADTTVEDKDAAISVNERHSTPKKIECQRIDQKSRRTSSAPPQRHLGNLSNNRVQVNIVIDTPSSLISEKHSNDKEKIGADNKDNTSEGVDVTSTKVSSQRAVRSAPLKRRSRSVKKRFCGAGSCKNDEDGRSRNRSSSRGKNSSDAKTMDIVTMVSLVSSADSDSDTENSPRDDKLIDELRSKLPTTSIIKTSMNTASSIARRPIKSVSFQRDSFDEDLPKEQQPLAKEEKKTVQPRLAIVNHRGNGGSLSTEETPPWRTDIPGLALPVLALIHDAEEASHDIPLTDREKRCLAVPIGDLHDKKRKLLKTRSTPSRSEMEKQMMSSKIKIHESPRIVPQKMETFPQHAKTPVNNSPTNVKQTFTTASRESAQQVQPTPTEPQFQTNKEKECWHLYRKMCDKGVCVSFDTVLRGMLTPTEYRLRQKKLFQN